VSNKTIIIDRDIQTQGRSDAARLRRQFTDQGTLVVSDLMIVTKTDLLPHVPFRVDRASADARLIREDIHVIEVCSLTNAGIEEWCQRLEAERTKLLAKGGLP
jgi:hypothetical protein